VRIGVKEDAKNIGGVNIFGKTFGDYEQDIIMKMEFEQEKGVVEGYYLVVKGVDTLY